MTVTYFLRFAFVGPVLTRVQVIPAQSLSKDVRRKIWETIIARLQDAKSDLKKKIYNDYDLKKIVIVSQIIAELAFEAEFHSK